MVDGEQEPRRRDRSQRTQDIGPKGDSGDEEGADRGGEFAWGVYQQVPAVAHHVPPADHHAAHVRRRPDEDHRLERRGLGHTGQPRGIQRHRHQVGQCARGDLPRLRPAQAGVPGHGGRRASAAAVKMPRCPVMSGNGQD
jgi:hypothetical protein